MRAIVYCYNHASPNDTYVMGALGEYEGYVRLHPVGVVLCTGDGDMYFFPWTSIRDLRFPVEKGKPFPVDEDILRELNSNAAD